MRIIFVCTGNTCRSPMAESLGSYYLPEHRIESRGLFAMEGDPISHHSKSLLEQMGLPIPTFAQPLQQSDLEADYIFTMTAAHKQLILNNYSGKANVYTLNEFVNINGEIADPIGGDSQIYLETFNQLKQAIVKLKVMLN
ncbi:low molecular weight protein arginine phosphatase [Staphylococcus sp. SQ8-PEA]|uniref:Low molecular weight protein-tyrosine-phosphatase PtpB n=1 Tax=Staphylococcus marylandisciuri TaxID=2981529 RepID=A0ABT2QRH0_9STAP|nr:low molecular weight protein arginine phosphatase [Staphylococcus marylandisciuri]MCU5746580.1 low molecular weight protein arginine phosphatase [Staphylococcus marylandisciuri]